MSIFLVSGAKCFQTLTASITPPLLWNFYYLMERKIFSFSIFLASAVTHCLGFRGCTDEKADEDLLLQGFGFCHITDVQKLFFHLKLLIVEGLSTKLVSLSLFLGCFLCFLPYLPPSLCVLSCVLSPSLLPLRFMHQQAVVTVGGVSLFPLHLFFFFFFRYPLLVCPL